MNRTLPLKAPRLLALAALLAATLACGLLGVPSDATAQVSWGDDEPDAGKGDTSDKDDKPDRPRVRACTGGKERSADTAGQCCWSGQGWNGRQCVGTPTGCPAGLVPDAAQQACVIEGCLAEMVLTTDGVHCCWPGQAWSTARAACIGLPECPENYVVKDDGCSYVPPDEDGDDIIDAVDACPTVREDVDGFEDLDGCPDEDNDRDNIADKEDQCPNEPEDLDDFQDKDGCPDTDDDKDGIADVLDKCPEALEDLDGFEDEDGCPDEDNDKDGIVDAQDQCPDLAEDINSFQDADGCPDAADAEAAEGQQTMVVLGWVTIGTGLALGGTSLALHLVAESKRDEVREPASVDEKSGAISSLSMLEAKQLEDDANTLDLGAGIALGVGAALVATGATLLVMRYADGGDTAIGVAADGSNGLVMITTRF